MIDISWGELVVLGSVGAALAGRRDLPSACRYVGLQVGRVVGLLQGARARADRFSAQNELRQLQNELRSGLRELDQVKTELVVAASMGRTLGATTPLANRRRPHQEFVGKTPVMPASTTIRERSIPKPEIARAHEAKHSINATVESSPLSPAIQSERASMEEEWEKRGISFRSIAEQGSWMQDGSGQTTTTGEGTTGSETLERIIQQNLVFDQYDRVVTSQEQELEQRIKDIATKGRKE